MQYQVMNFIATAGMETEREGFKQKIQWEINNKMDDLNSVEMKLQDKEEKLDIAIRILEEMNAQIADKKQDLEDVQQEFKRVSKGRAWAITSMIAAAAYEEIVADIQTTPVDAVQQMDQARGDSRFSDLSVAAADIFCCAGKLFIGNAAAAAAMASDAPRTGGGAGNESNDLPKRKKDEDDFDFARRCFRAARTLMAPKIKHWKSPKRK